MKRALVGIRRVVGVVCALLISSAFGQGGVAGLSVVSYGPQTLDLASGRTVLIAGGEIRDAVTGVIIDAAWISYIEGVEILAEAATVRGTVGLITAPVLRIDLLNGTLMADGGVRWQRDALETRAVALFYDETEALVGLLGGIVSVAPNFVGVALWIELSSQRALLVGPYRYQEGVLSLAGEEGSALQLDILERDGSEVFLVTSAVASDLLEAVARVQARVPAGFAE